MFNRKNDYFEEDSKDITRLILIISKDGCIYYNYKNRSMLGIVRTA